VTESPSHVTTDSYLACSAWPRASCGIQDHIVISVGPWRF